MKFFKRITALSLLGLLSACSTVRQHDGPPGYAVDVSKIPNAVPRVLPLSKNNPHEYEVRGRVYYTLRSSRHYDKHGIASWYGTLFDGHRTSTGERYSMLGMTAASKVLPLPTFVRVTNLRNGRQVIVKVNDRGPFVADPRRIIDLSYVAAKKLGMLAHGTAYVDVKAIDPVQFARNERLKQQERQRREMGLLNNQIQVAMNHPHPSIYLRVGTYQDRAFAERVRHRLRHVVGSRITVAQRRVHGHFYRLEVGPFKNRQLAMRMQRRIHGAGLGNGKILTG